jgi:hypothetical protein
MNDNFIKILFAVCTGTDIFKKIIKFSLFKAFRHLLLVSILCSFVFVLAKSSDMKKDINSISGYLQEQFGNVVVKKTGVYPEKKPGSSRSLNYNFTQINYFPKEPSNKEFGIDDKLNSSGFVWLPNSITGWLKLDDSNFFVYQALTSLDSHNWFGMVSKDEISSYLKNCTVNDFKDLRFSFFVPMSVPLFGLLTLHESSSFLDYSETIYHWSAFGIFMRFIITIIFNTILYSLLFATIYTISSKLALYNLKFKAFLVTAIYAGIPGIIIGTIFTIVEIPWLQYQTIYLISFIVYLMAVTQRLRKLNSDNNLSQPKK